MSSSLSQRSPESLFRQPNGIKAKGFFQKDIEMKVPDFVETHKIWSESNEKEIRYLSVKTKKRFSISQTSAASSSTPGIRVSGTSITPIT
jgi:DNA primase